MSNPVNVKVNHHSKSWDFYITEAESQLVAIKHRERGLLEVVARFKMFRDRGEPWPLEEVQESAQPPFAQSTRQTSASATQC
jgi:hypothetical protein